MLKINKGEPWIMWPNLLGQNFVKDPANLIFDHDGDFKFRLVFEIEEEIKEKSTLFAKLPSYFGFDLEEYGFLFIVTDDKGESEYLSSNFQWVPGEKYELTIKKIDGVITISIDDIPQLLYFVKDKLASDDNSHIIFGAGNFPKNGFNLNYASFIMHELEIMKDGKTMAKHEFERFVHNKSYDLTDNCNFIHKI
jgi:hypothetical protein